METTLFDTGNGADFSACRNYRFALWRKWNGTLPSVMFIGLNPSTANETKNDPTIRRVISMADAWGFGGVYMMNCFPIVSADPKIVQAFARSPFYRARQWDNDDKLIKISELCDRVIFAWGNFDVVKETSRDKELAHMFPYAEALVINKDGSPRHPLYVPKGVKPIKFKS